MFQKLKDDILTVKLVPLKLLFFCLFAANTVLYPYLAVHLQSLGFRADRAAVVFAIIPMVSIFGPPVAGLFADRLGNFRMFFSLILAVSGFFSLLLLVIPPVPLPPGLSLTLVYTPTPFKLDGSPAEKMSEVDPVISALPDDEFVSWVIVQNMTGCSVYEEYETTIGGLHDIDIGTAEITASANLTTVTNTSLMTLLTLTTDHHVVCPDDIELLVLSHSATNILYEGLAMYNFSLEPEDLSKTDPRLPLGCLIEIPGLCEPHTKDLIGAEALSFWLYLFLRSSLNAAVTGAFTLFEGATLSVLKKHDGDYGLQRFWGYIGSMVFTPLSGWLIDYVSETDDIRETDYRPAFYLFMGLQICAALIALTVDLRFKYPSKRVLKNIWLFLQDPEVIMLLLSMFLAGAFFGFLEAFLFWFLGDLGASKYLMGLTVTVGAVAALPFLIVASPIVNRFGHNAVISFAFLMYAVRFAGYSSIKSPIHALYFEALEGITVGLMLTAAIMYANELSTTENVVSLQGISGTLHYGVGKGVGCLVGGHMYHLLGARKTFRLMTVASLVSALIFFIFHLVYIKRHPYAAGSFGQKRIRKEQLAKEKKENGEIPNGPEDTYVRDHPDVIDGHEVVPLNTISENELEEETEKAIATVADITPL
ncbi:uncharacterized protein LOC143027029 isoform X2 [Oratosquilla oratoria]|uniref:uncharacterized protein LOC143027029 isoform X2 n=1 Tax=Oratosquilla oratoria TaxID=337810 RepID=UPI003F758627